MFVLLGITYLNYALFFFFSAICIACGLYYLAELAEEYTSTTKRLIRYTIIGELILHVLFLIFESFPFNYVVFGILAHGVYFLLLKEFPFITLTNPKFLLSLACLLVDHSLWFLHFSSNYMDFNQLVAFFVIMVWMVPFLYFLSLTQSEQTLPYGIMSSTGEVTADDFTYPVGAARKRGKHSQLLTALQWLKQKFQDLMPSSRTSQKLY